MKITRQLEQVLEEKLQSFKPAIVNSIQKYSSSLTDALNNGYTKASVAAHVMLEVDETMNKHVKWEAVKCAKGCASCCHVGVDITEGEADLIVDYCSKKNIQINKEVLKAQVDLSSSEKPLHKFSKCTFLGEDKACGIYEARPLNCRKHLSLSDPDLCNCKKHVLGSVTANFEINTEILVSAYNNLGMKEGRMAEMLLSKL